MMAQGGMHGHDACTVSGMPGGSASNSCENLVPPATRHEAPWLCCPCGCLHEAQAKTLLRSARMRLILHAPTCHQNCWRSARPCGTSASENATAHVSNETLFNMTEVLAQPKELCLLHFRPTKAAKESLGPPGTWLSAGNWHHCRIRPC